MKYHYTYRITNTNERMYYYGVRSCSSLPKKDIGIKYFSCSTDLNFIQDQKDNPQYYKYKIIKIFDTRIEAEMHEILLHKKFNVMFNGKFYNKWNSNSSWSTAGLTGVTEISSGNRLMITVEEYKNNKQLYISHSYNKVATLDLRDNINKWVTKEEFDNNDFYISTTHNKVATVDLRDNTNKQVTKEEFDNNDFYVGITHKYFPAVDLHGNKYHVHKDDMRVLSGELKHHSAYLINITDGVLNKRINPMELDNYVSNNWRRGVTITAENPTKNTKYMNKDGKRKRVKMEDITIMEELGWQIGMPKLKCENCGFEGAGSSMHLYHFNNCKLKEQYD